MTGVRLIDKGICLLVFLTVLPQWKNVEGAECADAIKPTNNIEGCEWKEKTDGKGCKSFKIDCKAEAKIDKGCLLDAEYGPCAAHVTKYYYNARVGKCSPFVYGGCTANANNFDSLAECSSVCIDGQPRKKPVVSLAANSGNDSLSCTGVNEQYYGCGACDSSCDDSTKTVCSLICRPAECGCIDGYVRNSKKICVAPEKCKDPVGPINVDPNAGSEDDDPMPTVKTTIRPTTPPTTRPTSTSTTTRPTSTSTTTRPTSTSTTTRPTSTSTTTRPTTRPTSTSTTTRPTTRPTSTSTTTRPTTRPTSTTARPTTRTTPTLSTLLTRPTTSRPTFTLHPSTLILPAANLTKPKQPLCSLITCPGNYACQNGTCIPPSGSKCDKLKMAVAADGCRHSFRNDSDGCSIPYLLCENLSCGENEEAKLCGACDGTCGSPVCIPAERCLKPSCGCFVGYVRDKANKCVPKSKCNEVKATSNVKIANSKAKHKKGSSTTVAPASSTTTTKPFTLPAVQPASSTLGFNSFQSKVLNSVYLGPGPVRLAAQN